MHGLATRDTLSLIVEPPVTSETAETWVLRVSKTDSLTFIDRASELFA